MNEQQAKRSFDIKQKLLGFFIKGLVFVLPLALTFYIIASGISYVDSLIEIRLPFFTAPEEGSTPGVGLVIVLSSITIIGILVTYFITEPVSNYFLRQLERIPLFKLIYSSIRDFMGSFFGEKKKFDEPVVVQMNELGLKRIGFITQKDLSQLGMEDEIGVYCPNSYGLMGEYYIINKKYVKPLHANPAEVMKHVVSGGVSDL